MKPVAATYDFEKAQEVVKSAFDLFEDECSCITSLRYALNALETDIPGFEGRTREGIEFLIEFGIIEMDIKGIYRLIL